MILLTPDLRFALRANAIQRHVALDRNRRAAVAATRPEPDPVRPSGNELPPAGG